MTTTVTIKTMADEGLAGSSIKELSITVGETAQKHVLRSFNPAMKENDEVGRRVDATKVLCAAIIQQMIDLRDAPGSAGHVKRACAIAITQCEALQMQAVKANFVQA